MNIKLRAYQKVTRVIYKFLGSFISTRLAKTSLGHLTFKLFNKGSQDLSIYEGIDGLKLRLTRDESYRLGFFHLGVINPFETNVIKKILKEGDCFIDVGAYVDGWHTLVASRIVGKKGKVYSFEPIYYQRLKENIKLNKQKNVTVKKLALSNKNSISLFYDRGEKSSLNKQADDSTQVKAVRVRTVTLDTFIKQNKIQHVRLLKIDVEGSEIPVLKGGIQLLKTPNNPDIIIEAVDSSLKSAGYKQSQLMSFLKKLGYKPYFFHREGLKPYNNSGHQPGFNLFFSKSNG